MTGWLLLGAGIGVLAANRMTEARVLPALMLLAAALPGLGMAVIAAWAASPTVPSAPTDDAVLTPPLPDASDERPKLLRRSVTAIGLLAACGAGWAIQQPLGDTPVSPTAAGVLLALGTGMLFRARPSSRRAPSLRGFGALCFAGGLSVLFAGSQVIRSLVASPLATELSVYVAMSLLGAALACGYDALLHRVALRATTASRTLGRAVTYGAILGPIAMPLMGSWFGGTFVTVFLAAVLIGLAVTLTGSEPSTAATRRSPFGKALSQLRERWVSMRLQFPGVLRQARRSAADTRG